jgi:N-acetylglucosaminyldiphosphoundecaprenol N-acetyl-beta-D-mannosaminyltransferase
MTLFAAPLRILVVQLADIGDLVLATPALAALRDAHPTAHIALLCTPPVAVVVQGGDLVDAVHPFPRKQWETPRALFTPSTLLWLWDLGRFDVVVFLHHFTLRLGTVKFAVIAALCRAPRRLGLQNGHGWFLTESIADAGFGARHQAQHWLDVMALLGADPSPRPARVHSSADDHTWAAAILPPTDAPYVALHAGSGGYSTARRWSAEHFAAVAMQLHRDGARVVLVGSMGDDTPQVRALLAAAHIPTHDLSGRTTLGQLAAALARCRLFIGAESGVMHIAAAAGVPLVALFGPGNPAAWGPWALHAPAHIIRSAPPCSPCSYVAHTVGLRHGCEARTCMRMIAPPQVVSAAHTLLHADKAAAPATAPAIAPSPAIAIRRDGVRVLGLHVDAITYAAWLERIGAWVQGDQAKHVCTINPEFIMVAQNDTAFYAVLNQAALCVPDGVGLLWAARHLGAPLPQRVTGSDGVPLIAAAAAERGWRIFLLGAADGVADKAAAVLRARHPALQIVGVYGGSPRAVDEDEIVTRVNASGADILFVAYGAPAQDLWIARNLPRLRVKMAMGVGGSLDFIAGVVPRAPQWMQRYGLEWLYRLYLQPWRIKRMLRLPRFVWAVLRRGARGPAWRAER